jgi:hypothetical protein
MELGEKRFDGVSDRSQFLLDNVILSVRRVPETAGLVLVAVVLHGPSPVVAEVDGPAIVSGNRAPPL